MEPIRTNIVATFDAAYKDMRSLRTAELEEVAGLLCASEEDAAASGDVEGGVIAGMGMRAALALLRFHSGPTSDAYVLTARQCGFDVGR